MCKSINAYFERRWGRGWGGIPPEMPPTSRTPKHGLRVNLVLEGTEAYVNVLSETRTQKAAISDGAPKTVFRGKYIVHIRVIKICGGNLLPSIHPFPALIQFASRRHRVRQVHPALRAARRPRHAIAKENLVLLLMGNSIVAMLADVCIGMEDCGCGTKIFRYRGLELGTFGGWKCRLKWAYRHGLWMKKGRRAENTPPFIQAKGLFFQNYGILPSISNNPTLDSVGMRFRCVEQSEFVKRISSFDVNFWMETRWPSHANDAHAHDCTEMGKPIKRVHEARGSLSTAPLSIRTKPVAYPMNDGINGVIDDR
ncbi:uncharacterized protein EV420DRAFT_1479951 [Desarmillaria tabescens]|uniref:Uncharacterized protein n=1 Tax=Armillaria tabescens TaxID=1929756 RepID=A0AA39N529_ARMTA|nr:uncharacterized protein EV420DRAFT_1479951 [Desarmillaria tabescens]KAK0458207.1 hypothetical protein EV420DRAFT_1479951 [Desarmillaria tabescens]